MKTIRFLLALVGALCLSAGAFAGAAPPPLPPGLLNPSPFVTATIQTSLGDIVVRLDRLAAPRTVANFLRYAREGHFDDTLFYRVVRGFVIQAGSVGADNRGRPDHESIPLESSNGLKNVRGAISMARASDPNSATAEFFIVLVDNPDLDPEPGAPPNTTGYAVFGHVVEGMDVVDKIAAEPVGAPIGPFPESAPVNPVVIRKVLIANP